MLTKEQLDVLEMFVMGGLKAQTAVDEIIDEHNQSEEVENEKAEAQQ